MKRDSSKREGLMAKSALANDLRQRKKQLRSACEEVREKLGQPYRDRASEFICEQVREWTTFRAARVVFAYLSMRGEVDLGPLFARSDAVSWAIPRVVDSPVRHLVFHVLQPDRLVRHRYGMLEPDATAPEMPVAQADLIIVPGMAFARSGSRLGYGGGYYDRLLGELARAPALGVCYQALLLDEIPHGRYDVPVDYLVTESSGVIDCRAAP